MKFTWPTTLSAEDRRDVVRLMNEVAMHETTLGFHEEITPETGESLMADFDEDLQHGRLHLLAVRREEDDRIVGMVTLAQAALPARRHVVELRRCTVDPTYRGSFLLEGFGHALRRVAAIGGEVVTLEVREDGPVDLWQRIGFQSYGLLPDYARVRGTPIKGHFMFAVLSDLVKHFETTGSWLHERVREPAQSPA